MAVTQAMCTSFKGELMQGLHNFTASTGNTFKIALYTSLATYGAATQTYTASTANEVPAGGGYTTGGNTLTNITPTTSGTTGFADFADVSWSSASFTANGAMIYNSTNSNRAVCLLAFGGDKVVSSGTFTIVFPTPDATNAIIRIA